jgi:hypothetical protein
MDDRLDGARNQFYAGNHTSDVRFPAMVDAGFGLNGYLRRRGRHVRRVDFLPLPATSLPFPLFTAFPH